MNIWNKISEELPEEFEDVLVTDENDVWLDSWSRSGDGNGIEWNNMPEATPTRWMYLPDPPEGSEEAPLFSIVRTGSSKDQEEIRIEISKDMEQEDVTGAFTALLQVISTNKKLMNSFSKAVEIIVKHRDAIKDANTATEGMLS